MKKIAVNIYQLSELSEKAKERAILDHLIFLDSIPEECEENGEMISQYIEHTTEDAIDSIQANEYHYYHNGQLANCVTYCGKHPKAGITELTLNGEIYTL